MLFMNKRNCNILIGLNDCKIMYKLISQIMENISDKYSKMEILSIWDQYLQLKMDKVFSSTQMVMFISDHGNNNSLMGKEFIYLQLVKFMRDF